MSAPDQELVARFVRGDKRAFEQLMRIHEDRVFAVCMRITGNREAALDAAQETFLNVFRKAHQYQGGAEVGTWLYRIAVNVCYDHLRKARRRATESLAESVDPADPATEDTLSAVELRPDLEAALASIPSDFRAAVVLADVEGLALQEVAEILEVPVGTVKSRIFRGRRLLAQRLGNLRSSGGHPSSETHA